MAALWHPKAVRRTQPDANYGRSAPHFTFDPSDGTLWQHIPLNRAARALMAGGPNFWNTVQVELIGFADTAKARRLGVPGRAVVNWPKGHYERSAQLARWIEENSGVPRKCTVEFVGHRNHLASLDAVKRYAGHIGHQHINGNDHWDPGLLKINLILTAKGAGAPARTVAPAAPAQRDLGRGDEGPDVRALQKILAKRGYGILKPKINGVFGRATEAFVVHFQWKHGLHTVGLDPLLVIAQMVLETDNLSSFWSQPPRRNPAGIGVTGEAGAGVSFPNWNKAVAAHVGRLLAYAVKAGSGTEKQRALITRALKVRPLPDDRRGVAPTLSGLTGTWATDPHYATKIAAVANEIRA